MQVKSFWLGCAALALAALAPGAGRADSGPARIGLRDFPPLTRAEQ